MIQQKVKIAKKSTSDGMFEYSATIGMEFWINVNTFAVRDYVRKGTDVQFQALVVKAAEYDIYLPAEILEYMSEFRITNP